MSCPRFLLGYSDEDTVKLDFDNVSFHDVKYWASRTTRWFKLRGFLILKSSENCYHVVFDRVVSWSENMRIVAWVALHSHNKGLLKWFMMQCIKGCSTLRVASKREKLPPRVVCRYGEQNQNVKEFLKNRRIIKKIQKKMQENGEF